MPMSAAISRARRMAAGEKSAPVTRAPSRAHDRVSMPKWHWRWSSVRPRTSPTAAISSSRQPDATRAEPREVVEVALGVDRRPRLPQALVRRERSSRGRGCSARHHSDQRKTTSGARSALRQNRTRLPASSRIQGFSSRGQRAELLLEPIDPAARHAVEGEVRDGRHGRDPGRVDALDGQLGARFGARVAGCRRARCGRR